MSRPPAPPPPPPPETGIMSPLDKPLSELTEDDIAQLTREDCRRFLKQKGMRRPSWNKSQAIQQVISLKALLEDRPDSVSLKNLPLPQVVPTQRVEDPSPCRRKDPDPIPPQKRGSRGEVSATEQRLSPRGKSDNLSAAQMTILYGGNVNVYNNVPVDNASAIMQLAASPIDLNNPIPGPVHVNKDIRS